IRLLIRVLDALPLFRYGRRLRSLPRAKRQRFLERIQSSRIYKLRQGFWGLRSLIYMGYYARAEASVEIGYGARLRGWSDHPDAPESARAGTGAGARAGAGGAGHGDHAGEPLP
ncbi:MAG: hypothetical protein GWM90_07770, partial [Gemmatimonadetes bacterium]|nr:hypothetical protein [Gemmatimonadota bacterium]NIQ53757.1 hypothetical protein [Gemmatimonadota bacterium]NIU73936.1 hypothetical protein [Gammaproteobacteria bacterium]NIX44010.1 hypothetical protein [Gemmatimonadota bacterium]NIY08218.1 hypothetical protein [Gemmatimonadota bacterium]